MEKQLYKRKMSRETLGLVYGIIGILGFSLTLPLSRYAVNYFGSVIVGPGRAIIAAFIAILALFFLKEKLPAKSTWWGISIVAFGAIIAFPLLSSWAMTRLPASHGAVELALLPLATAGAAVWRNGERPSVTYWAVSSLGALIVLIYAFLSGFGSIHPADLSLMAAVIIVAVSYAEGGRLSSILGGWQVIAWALVMAAPIILVIVFLNWPDHMLGAPASAWACLIYLGAGSQFLAFVAWYTGLGTGGIARVSQVQYFQPFFTIVFSYFLLGEKLTVTTVITVLLLIGVVSFGKKTAIRKKTVANTKVEL